LDQNTWTLISQIVILLAALVGGAAGAILTNLYTRSQERKRKEREVIDEMYTHAVTVRRIIEPSLVAASAPNTTLQSTWLEPMIRMVMLTNLYLHCLKPAL